MTAARKPKAPEVTPGLEAVINRWPIAEETVAFRGGWQVELRACPGEEVTAIALRHAGEADVMQQASTDTVLACVVRVTQDGEPLDEVLVPGLIRSLPAGQQQRLVDAVNRILGDDGADPDFSEPQSGPTPG